MKKLKILVYKNIISIIFILLFFSDKAFALYFNQFEPNIPNEIEIHLPKKSFLKYNVLISEEQNSFSIIDPKSKKYIKSKLIIKKNNKKKILNARIRLIGDYKDHISFSKNISSLQVKIIDNNLGGVTRFRLYLPTARNIYDEIFWSSTLEILGWPNLYKKKIIVNFNGQKYEALFEELPNKEFLERWSIRETAVIEYDERFTWLQNLQLEKNKNLKKNKQKFKINDAEQAGLPSYKLDNSSLIKNKNHSILSMIAIGRAKELYNSNNYSYIVKKYDDLNKLAGATHGLSNHNRKFIYDPFYNEIIPLYFDGEPKIELNSECKNLDKKKQHNLDKLKIIYFHRTGRNLQKYQECFAIKIFNNFKNFKEIYEKNFYLKENIKKNNEQIKDHLFDYGNLFYFDNSKNNFCIQKLKKIDCNIISPEKQKNIISGKLENYLYVDNKITWNYGIKNFNHPIINNSTNLSDNYNIDSNEILYLKLDKNSPKNIKFFLHNSTSRIVIFDSIINNLNLTFELHDQNIKNETRNNKINLTGCVTFINSYFNSANIDSKNMVCEDSINIINSNGSINNIDIVNSYSDALDIDMSKISIENIYIKNAGNDCIDFSYGEYLVNNINLNKCYDKGISIGENSFFLSNYSKIDNSKTAIANKDSSLSVIQNLYSTNNEICKTNYKKKNEFEKGQLIINFLSCDGDEIVKRDKIRCKYFSKEYSVKFCLDNDELYYVINSNLYDSLKIRFKNNERIYKICKEINKVCSIKFENDFNIQSIHFSKSISKKEILNFVKVF